ncbi:MAG: hypothetical protein FJ146_05805 [Deltaproteobacteria bacterium]|nr:hypothetical protein [Deltaproteobacteria bacterium]
MWSLAHHAIRDLVVGILVTATAVGCGNLEPTAKKVGVRSGGKTSQPPSTSAQPKAGKDLYFLLDGYGTCPNFSDTEGAIAGTNMTRILDDLVAALKAKAKPEPTYLLACFTPAAGSIYFTTNEFPKFTQYVAINDFTAKVGQMVGKEANASVHIVGYSYGGWTAMKVAKEIELAAGTSLKTLVTIDPISVTKCTPNDLLGSAGGQPAPGCSEAPADFGADGLGAIKAKATLWSNYYQDEPSPLHSGSIVGAENADISLTAAAFTAHMAIATDAGVRQKVVDSLTR